MRLAMQGGGKQKSTRLQRIYGTQRKRNIRGWAYARSEGDDVHSRGGEKTQRHPAAGM